MKFNYKKIASIIASSVMLSSTVGFAAAATYPSPFTEGTAVVYGTAAANTDMMAAIEVYDQLKSRTSGSTDSSVSGDAKAIETSSQPLYLGEFMNNTKQTLTSDDLKSVLANGQLEDTDGKSFNYELKISTPNTKVIYGDTADNLATPVLYADWDNAAYKYSLKVIFPTAVNVTKLTDKAITLFGKQYVFSGNVADLTTTSLVLFERATPVIINDGESKTIDGHTISVAVEDASTVSISVDGVTESKREGNTARIGGVDLYIKNVVGPSVAGTSRYAELYLNSNKITLANADEVTVGSDDISGTNVTILNSGGKVTEIQVDVFPRNMDDDVKYTKQGTSFIDPVFKTIKLDFASITPELTAESRDMIQIKPTGETKVGLKFTNRAGKTYDLDVLGPSTTVMLNQSYAWYYNASASTSDVATYYTTKLQSGDYDFQVGTDVGATGNITVDDYFVTCSADYTQIWRLEKITTNDNKKEIEVRDVGSPTDDKRVLSLTLGADRNLTSSLTLADGNSATLKLITGNENTTVINSRGCAKLYTKQGSLIDLTYANNVNASLTGTILINEETSYNGGQFKDTAGNVVGRNLSVRFAYASSGRSGKDMFISSTMDSPGQAGTLNTDYWSDDVGDYDYYYLTKYGSFIKRTGDTDKQVDIYFTEDAMKLGFYIGEVSSAITPGSTGATGGQISIITDAEVATATSKNLIVVGGSCVNRVAAKILGGTDLICAEDFSAKTKVSAGGYIIKVVKASEAVTGGSDTKVAMLVAGYNAADTQNAVKRAMVIDGVSTTVGSEEIYPVTSAS
ncbi:MAG: hypothetical protein WC867_07695 [Candidatus Pacearchaeota archaeon]|jgi:hypothetical protein